jgi:hypothetical protein
LCFVLVGLLQQGSHVRGHLVSLDN